MATTRVNIDQATLNIIKEQLKRNELEQDHLKHLQIQTQAIEMYGWDQFEKNESNRVVNEKNDEKSFFLCKKATGEVIRVFCTINKSEESIIIEVKILQINANYYDDS